MIIVSIIIFLTSVLQIVFNLAQVLINKDFIDFSVYWQALDKFLAGKNPYSFLYPSPGGTTPFNYPPSALILFAPFKLLPIKAAEIIFIILSFASLWLTLWLVIKILKIKISLPHFLLILAFFNQTFPVKFTLVMGQINLIVLGLSFLGLYKYTIGGRQGGVPASAHLRFNRRSTGGKELPDRICRIISIVCFSLASAIKLFPLYTLPLFFILRDYRFVFSVVTIFFLLNILPSFNLFKEYFFQILPNLSKNISQPWFYDQSITAFIMRLTNGPLLTKYLTLVILLLIFFFILNRFRQLKKNLLLSFSLIFALFSIGNVFSWQHHLIFAYPLILISYLKLRKWGLPLVALAKWGLVLGIWFLLAFHFKNEDSPLLANPLIASYQTIIVLFLIAFSLRRLNGD